MTATLLIKFTGGMSEHGPHIPALGPDGLIYIVVGNFAAPDAQIAKDSPHRHFYEGDLVQPKYEDAGGHAVGFKAPGGVVLRTDLEGSFVERFAGGLRNAYSIAFNRDGELFTYDSDMEWDEGLPWYRPTRVLHIVPGAEFGWRSGWSIWPAYFLDSLPPILETGRGSPSGIEVYEHYAFPAQYHGAMFACDWTNGRILAITLRPAHGTYQATSETFIEGKPLNVTDAKVGPEGALYFCTGGRATEGGVYRVVYDGAPAAPRLTGIQRALQQPQFYSAYSREAIAAVQEQLGDEWGTELARVALDARSPTSLRLRALDLMHLYGPFPSTELLVEASKDAQPMVRARSAALMGLHADETTHQRLVELLEDAHPTVRRRALEALVRAKQEAPIDRTIALLGDPDAYVAWAARMALLEQPAEQWGEKVIAAESLRVFNHASAALLALATDRETALKVLARAELFLRGYASDDDFVDLLRVMQVAMHRGNIAGDDVPRLRALLAEEYPANAPQPDSPGHRINRELLRLLAHMQESSILPRVIEEATGHGPLEDRLHAAIHARFITAGWTQKQKETMLGFFEQARDIEGGYSLSRYIENVARDFVANFTDDERAAVLRHAQHWPAAALGVLMKLPENPGPEMLAHLREIDGQLAGNDKEAAQRLRIGIAAVLARSKDEQAMAYLRSCFENEPERRPILAMGLAQSPEGENWPLLIRALPVLDGPSAVEVLQNLLRVEVVPEKADSVRQVILCGLRLGGDGGEHAVKLLEFWFDEQLGGPDDSVAAKLKAAQAWYSREFPEEPPATLPVESAQTRYTLGDLEKFLSDKQTQGDPGRGEFVFTKAQCVKCHRFGNRGEVVGPDLTTVSRRFQKKEVLESVLLPSHVISDQYASKNILTTDGRQITGIVGRAGPGQLVILTPNAQKLLLRESDVEQMEPSSVSAMPEGLFNNLTLEEIADLFAYLYSPTMGSRRTARRAEAGAGR
jgi:putative heme-binding domain-containing protein